MKKNYALLVALCLMVIMPFSMLNAQTQTLSPDKIVTPTHFDVSKNLRDVEPVIPGYRDRSWKDKVVKNMDGFLEKMGMFVAQSVSSKHSVYDIFYLVILSRR